MIIIPRPSRLSHYLKRMGAKNEKRRLTIHRREVVQDFSESTDLRTLSSLVSDSLKKSRARDRAYDETERAGRMERKRDVEELKEEIKQKAAKASKVLLKQELVTELSTDVMESQETRRRSRMSRN
jgi:hypothetical protein